MQNAQNDECDDCPMCRVQMKADKEGRKLTLDEFIAASKEAEKMGAIVSSSMDDMPVFPRGFSPDGFAMEPSFGPRNTWPFPSMDNLFTYEVRKMAGSPKSKEEDKMPFINRPPAEA